MSVAAIIAEYNPFHNGHAYQLNKVRELTGADHIIVIMSGDFVQRGAPAVMDKYLRTRQALLGGADLVIELPVWMATGPALDFAQGAVRILDRLGLVDHLCFGVETNDPVRLESAALFFQEESPIYQKTLQGYLKEGVSYARARKRAYEEITGDSGDFLESPNNILAISYLQALKTLDSKISPLMITRQGSYHNLLPEGQFASATAIRHMLDHAFDQARAYLPPVCLDVYQKEYAISYPITREDYWPMLQYKIFNEMSAENSFYDLPLQLHKSLNKAFGFCKSYHELTDSVTSPTYPASRVHRGLLHMLLDLKSQDVNAFKASDTSLYARVLGFKTSHADLLGKIKQKTQIPLLTKAMAMDDLKRCPDPALKLQSYALDVKASNLYSLIQRNRYGKAFTHEYACPLVKI